MFKNPKICNVSGDAHLVALDGEGRLCHRIRHRNSEWDDWGRLSEEGFISVDICGIGDELQVIAQTKEGILKHNIRYANGDWQGWEDPPGDSLLDPFGDES